MIGDRAQEASPTHVTSTPVADSIVADVARRSVIATFQDGTTAEAHTFYGALIIDARHADKFDLASRHRLPVTVVRQGEQPFAAYVVDVNVAYRSDDDDADPRVVHLEPLTTPQPRDIGAASRSLTSERVEEESGSSSRTTAHPQPPTTSPVANATFLAASHDGAWYLPDGAALTFAAATPTADDHRGVPATAKADGGSTTFLLFKSAPTPTPGAACDNGEPTTRQGVTVGHNATATATTTTAPACCENAATIRKNSP